MVMHRGFNASAFNAQRTQNQVGLTARIVNCQRLQNLLGAFDPDWRQNLESFLVDERKAAVDSLIGLRNSISHGTHVGVTFVRTQDYYRHVQQVVDRIAELGAP